MAFDNTEKHKIMRFLCYPANTLVPESTSYSKITADRLLNIPEEAEDEVRSILERISDLDDGLVAGVGQAGVKKIDDIEFFSSKEGGSKLDELRKERKRLIGEISSILDIPSMCRGSGMGNICV